MKRIFTLLAVLGLPPVYSSAETLALITPPQAENEVDSTTTMPNNHLAGHFINPEENSELLLIEHLSKSSQWHHLLFYKNGKAEVISPSFYLSDPKSILKSQFDPLEELKLTIDNAGNNDIVCKYPARYFWLKEKIPALSIDLQRCKDLPDANQRISLVLISNYLKNPASSFGHVLIKTSNPAGKEKPPVNMLSSEDLLNSSYNFGARIPQDENGIMYALKGLFGLYDAGFSEAEFFKQDAVYSKHEQRDMWEYVLSLDSFDTQLLNYHLHEAKLARFDYYFIKQNCGYRSGEILELVSDIKTTERIGAWYAPDYVFDQLVEYDDKNEPLIASVHYLPSEQTQLREKFKQLPKPLQTLINSIIKSEDINLLDTLGKKEKALVLDFLILHRTYKTSQDDTPENRRFKKELIKQRFNLPVGNPLADLQIPNKVSPALSNKTTQTRFAVSEEMAEIGLSLFTKDPLNRYTDINKRFEAVQTSVGYSHTKNKWSLTDFIFLDMQQIEDITQPLVGEPTLSWQLKTGARIDPLTGDEHSPYGQVGVGVGKMLGSNMVGYGLASAIVHDDNKHLDAGLELGLRAKRNGRAAELTYTAYKREGSEHCSQTELTLRQELSKNNDIRLELSYADNLFSQNGINAGIAWHHYW